MKGKIASISVLAALLMVPVAVFWYEEVHIPSVYDRNVRVIDVTGFAGTGVWTLEEVRGVNYWWKHFEPATIVVEEGEDVILRLRSSDMAHQFYVPALGIEPVTVMPGHMVEVRFTAVKAGVYQYYCTAMCDECHFYMRGWIVIAVPGQDPVIPDPVICPICSPDFPRPPDGDLLRIGEYLYLKKACVTCHGIEGRGGVENFNYLQVTVPAHNTTAEKFFLDNEEDTAEFMELIMSNADMEAVKEDPPFPTFLLAYTRYQQARDIIKGGKEAARLDPEGPSPPLQMPAWGKILTDRDIDALLVYFLSLYPWDDDMWEEEGDDRDGDNG